MSVPKDLKSLKRHSPLLARRVILNQKAWDDRFWLGRIPNNEEKSHSNKNSQSKGRPNTGFSTSQKNLEIPSIFPQRTISRISRHALASTYSVKSLTVKDETLDKLKNQIELEWESKSIPSEQRKVFRDHIFYLVPHHAVPAISQEIEDLKRYKSCVQECLRAVKAREESIETIKEMNQHLKNAEGWKRMKEVQMECAEMLGAYRILSLNAVESIVKWRSQLERPSQQLLGNRDKILFIYEGEDYLAKMRNDIEFLKDSELSCIFRFSFKSDPFLVKPSMYLERNGKHLIMQDELAIIPLPNMLIKRIQYAESIIFEAMKAENSKKSTPLNTSTMILNTDYVLCKEIMGSFLNEATDAGISQILNSLKLNEKLLDKALKFITESLVNSYTKKAVKKISKSTSTDLLSFEINLDILNSEIEKCIIDIGNLEMDAQKKQISHEINRRKLLNLIDLQIAEGVFRNLFEKMIEEIDLEHLAETAVAQELDLKMSEVKNDIDIRKLLEKERKILDEKIGSVMGISIVNEFVDEEWLYGLCRNLHTKHASKINVTTAPNQMILQEPEDQAMENFTPDVHSPREYSPNEIDLQEPDTNRSVYSVFNLDFASEDDFADLSDLQIKPIFSKEHKISAIINEYYQYIPSNYRAVVPKIDQLVSLVNKGINPCWYWITKDNNIMGLLVFSLDWESTTERIIIIHHISCLKFECLSQILEVSVNFIYKVDPCDSVRIKFYLQNNLTEIPVQIKQVITEQEFRWKTHNFILDYNMEVIVMGKSRGTETFERNPEVLQPFRLSSYCAIQASKDDVRYSEDRNLQI